MTARPQNRIETRFEGQGSIPRPRLIGRAVRLFTGLWLTLAAYDILNVGPGNLIGSKAPDSWNWWALFGLGLLVTPYVINIGFTRNWKHWPRIGIVAASALAIGADLVFFGTWWAPPLGVFVFIWSFYWTAHLGISFVLSSLISTPGCEMRSIPHAWTLLTGRTTKEHYCPGPLDRIDRWERSRFGL